MRDGVISYGVSSYGYDMRVADEFRIFTNVNSSIVDPKHFDSKSFVEFKGDVCIVPPNSFALGRSVEYFRIPRKCSRSASASPPTRAAASSSTSRRLSPNGKASSPSKSATPPRCPRRSTRNEGLCQVIFFESDEAVRSFVQRQKGKVSVAAGNRPAEALSFSRKRRKRRGRITAPPFVWTAGSCRLLLRFGKLRRLSPRSTKHKRFERFPLPRRHFALLHRAQAAYRLALR